MGALCVEASAEARSMSDLLKGVIITYGYADTQ